MSRFVSPALVGGTLLTTFLTCSDVIAKPASEGAKFSLMRPVALADGSERGTIDVREKAGASQSRLRVKAKELGEGAFDLFMEEPPLSGTMVSVGALVLEDGVHRLRFDTKKGDQLPFSAASIDDLVGRRVEIRRDDASVRLVGLVPEPVGKQSVDHDKQKMTGFDGAKGGLHVVERSKHGRVTIDMKGGGLPAGSSLAFQVDDGGGQLVTVGMVSVNEDGKGKLHLDTKKGDPLPFGALTLDELAGRPVELCDPGQDGLVLLTGVLP